MILNGLNNQRVELRIAGSEFSRSENLFSDSNWLNVFIDVKSSLGNWQNIDQSLMLSEFKELINWFRDLSMNRDVDYPQLYFTEPNLEFELISEEDGVKHIRMIFSAESKPKSAKEGQGYFVGFSFSNKELAQIADELENELKNI